MEDQKIIELFFARSELAIQALAAKYEKLLHKISFHILQNNEDVAECLNDTYLGVWNAIPPARPNPLSAFVCKIARNLSLKRYRNNTAAKRDGTMDVSLEELSPCIPTPSAEEEWNAIELGRHINDFLGILDKENRVLFVRRYWFADSVGEIAKDLHISENLASVRLRRIRKQLQKYLEQEGYDV
ncbi:MAG: sigma-70 family RNA polymerase sigma factor [Lachnospiraceae bacterium]|nr:sigma-70 family RNA polymerase sigma factor [Lachnospiraceae bacterium]